MSERVAAYCRVSTEQDDQVNSLQSQKRYFTQYIEQQPDWQLVEVYADEGVSGTNVQKRQAFQRLLADARAGRFTLLLTKEISRFARNTLDSILYTRQLKELGVGVIFLNDNINTLDADAELRLTIMASIAQEESRKTSERVKWGQKRRMEQGVVFGRDLLGYDVREGQLYLNERGAETVRLIFHKFVREGKGSQRIAHELREAGIPTATYMKDWSPSVILRILRNEKYCGDLVQKKTYTPNYLTHQKKYNQGAEEQVILRDHHTPIISRELWQEAQAELARRSPTPETCAKHSNRYAFSGKLKCSCGASYVARAKKRQDGSELKTWRCYARVQEGSAADCGSPSWREDDLRLLLQQILAHLPLDRETLLHRLSERLRTVLSAETADQNPAKLAERIAALEQKRRALLELHLDGQVTKVDFQALRTRYTAEIEQLQERRTTAEQAETGAVAAEKLRCLQVLMRDILMGERWQDTFYRQLLDRITVEGEQLLTVRLRHLEARTYRLRAQIAPKAQEEAISVAFVAAEGII